MKRGEFLKIVAFLVIGAAPSLAAPPKKSAERRNIRTTGMFSDLYLSPETGDVGGWNMFFFMADEDYVLLVHGEGELWKPELCRVARSGNAVQFRRGGVGTSVEFKGTFTATHLTGKFSDSSSLKIPRKKGPLLSTFSDLEFSKETGDAMGMEIVSFLADQPYVLILEGAGDLRPPVIVPARQDDKKLSFSLRRPDGSTARFVGTESKTFFSGVFTEADGTKLSVKLPAKKSFWE
jgi:hypothetical protein